ncbi:hypothetical protein C8N46_101399 [Kordia periserrulae]|uniref:Uncharacterized protein n=1 Tax=Kordia periserrulae TaxID=701523 RepID=A0A2T6C631_9FLAO|nr:hypothetical protein [Kordia periserrulae]PTX63791.1 hypothetical protein C8N46_101399 [Kordia periserrulae]
MEAKHQILLEFYKKHENSMLNHESQRASMTNIILTVSTILTAVITNVEVSIEKMILSALLMILGLFGSFFSIKHYERFSWHLYCSRLYKEKIHEDFPNTSIDNDLAKKKIRERFGWIHKSRLYKYWISIQIIISVIGLILTILSIVQYSSS